MGKLTYTAALAAAILAGCATMSQTQSSDGFWPKGKSYAVSLTYDDGLKSQIVHALPVLKEAGFRGTFFFSGAPNKFIDAADIEALKDAGQELAAHTLKHPCARSFDWVQPGDALEDYDLARMGQELDENLDNLAGHGTDRKKAVFAYPCGMTYVGEKGQSYIPLVKERFLAARGVQRGVARPGYTDLHEVPGFGADKENLSTWAANVKETGAWGVLVFHGVGGDHLSTPAEDHRLLIETLRADSSAWVAPFSEIAAWMKAKGGAGR